MKITGEMMMAAASATGHTIHPEDLRKALEAALSASPAGVVKPKPLEWEYDEEGWYSVQTVCGPYEARVTDRGAVRIRKPSEAWQSFEGDIDAAFAFLFDDYSARIMSAIEPAGVGVDTPPPSQHVAGSGLMERLEATITRNVTLDVAAMSPQMRERYRTAIAAAEGKNND